MADLFTVEELRVLNEVERRMDRGEIPWVRLDGASQSVSPEIMKALGLEVGQRITWFMFGEILRLSMEHCQEQIAYERGQRLIAEELLEPDPFDLAIAASLAFCAILLFRARRRP